MDGIRTGVHVCRGNWSRKEEVLLTGDYTGLLPAFSRMQVQQLVLEYATPRAGDIAVVARALDGKELGLGVVNPRTAAVETPQDIVAQVETALRYMPPDALYLNPDCGFGCFATRCVNDASTAAAKLKSISQAARILRDRY